MLTTMALVCLFSFQDLENTKVQVLFLSKGNVCQSMYMKAIFNSIKEHKMQEFVECASKVWFSALIKIFLVSSCLVSVTYY